jgi:parvulin-like peptidyl-prolyl isomerase
MTFRTRQPAKPTRRRARQIDTRRAIWMNVTFGLVVVAAVAVLGGIVFANWYADHWATISTVNGQTINKDAVRQRAAVDLARYDRQLRTYGTMRNQGAITSDEYSSLSSSITQNETPATLYANALSELQNEIILQQYADKNGISVTDAQVQAAIQKDATVPELRHVKIIGVQPTPTAPAAVPSSSDILTALTKAEQDLKDIQSGAKKWDDVFTAEGSVGATGTTGDIGLTTKDGLNLDPELSDAIFALKNPNDITKIFKGSDGVYRFATVTEIVPTSVDSGWKDAVVAASSGDAYTSEAHGAAVKQAVKDQIEAQYVTGATTQRSVQEIAFSPGYGAQGDGDEVKVRIMVFAPKHSVAGASGVAATDPAWTDAKTRAQAAVDKLKADPSQFATMAKDTSNNDDTNFAAQGGEVPWLPQTLFGAGSSAQAGLGYTTVPTELFKDGLTPNQIIGPIQEPTAGYVVLEYLGRQAAPGDRIAGLALELSAGTVDFTTVASTQSQASDASSGGDMGWVSPYMLSTQMESAIYGTPVGQVSQIVVSTSSSTDPTTGAPTTSVSGYWIFKVNAQEKRVADPLQQERLAKVVFPLWLDGLYGTAKVTTDSAALTALSSTATAAPAAS